MSETLKPCPFCGGEGFVADLEGDGWVAGCNAGQERAEDDQRCRESAIGFYADTREEAIAAWNRRAPASDAGTGPEQKEESEDKVALRVYARAYSRYLQAEGENGTTERLEALEAALLSRLRAPEPRETQERERLIGLATAILKATEDAPTFRDYTGTDESTCGACHAPLEGYEGRKKGAHAPDCRWIAAYLAAGELLAALTSYPLRSAPPGEPEGRTALAVAEDIRGTAAKLVHRAGNREDDDARFMVRMALACDRHAGDLGYYADGAPGEPEQPESEGEHG